MTQSANENRSVLGFLKVTETDSGYVGGMLVTNHLGRPLEFQCTTPVRPNRTQEILYGPTLAPFVYVELIGKTLFERVAVKPQLIVIQQDTLLELRSLVDCPIGCLRDAGQTPDLPDHLRIMLGRQSLWLHPQYPEDAERVSPIRSRIPDDADLVEPLDRIQDALHETLRSGAVA